jgi:hypothetical protein
MRPPRLSALLSAASYLCSAADDLRASGLGTFAKQIDDLIAVLDGEIGLCEAADGWREDWTVGSRADPDP